MRVQDLMDAEPPVATVPSTRQELLALFAKHRVRGLAVLKADSRKLAGTVARVDLFRDPDEDQVALLMNPNPYTMYSQAPLREAAQALIQTQAPLLPVVTSSNDLLGILTPGACLTRLLNHRGRVRTYLRRRAVPIHVATPAVTAFTIQRVTQTPALPVLDDEGRLVGIVTDGDLVDRAGPNGRLPGGPVRDIMVRSVGSVTGLATVGEAARLLVDRGWHQLPVVDERGGLVDLVTDIDLLAALS